MSETEKSAPHTGSPADKTDKIEDAELEKVSGGINPQPLPPARHEPPPSLA